MAQDTGLIVAWYKMPGNLVTAAEIIAVISAEKPSNKIQIRRAGGAQTCRRVARSDQQARIAAGYSSGSGAIVRQAKRRTTSALPHLTGKTSFSKYSAKLFGRGTKGFHRQNQFRRSLFASGRSQQK